MYALNRCGPQNMYFQSQVVHDPKKVGKPCTRSIVNWLAQWSNWSRSGQLNQVRFQLDQYWNLESREFYQRQFPILLFDSFPYKRLLTLEQIPNAETTMMDNLKVCKIRSPWPCLITRRLKIWLKWCNKCHINGHKQMNPQRMED